MTPTGVGPYVSEAVRWVEPHHLVDAKVKSDSDT
jgi:hypothetical protein